MKNDLGQSLIHFTFLGQAGFLIQFEKCRILIDPYLSNYVVDGGIGPAELFSREFPAPIQLSELTEIDFLFITHDHADHCDPHTILPLVNLNPKIRIICPKPAAAHLVSQGVNIDHIIVPETGKLIQQASLNYYSVPAAHYQFDQDAVDNSFAYFGYVINFGEMWIYHSGDTILYDGMVDIVLSHTNKIDMACLPVNGRDGWRERLGMTGNLDGAEALELALKLHADVIIPMHNDLFISNHVNPAILTDLVDKKAPRQKVHWLQPGEDYYYSK
ncbi:MAG: MBL fold metallo-hydrolase [Anaerolineaceae bacterium]